MPDRLQTTIFEDEIKGASLQKRERRRRRRRRTYGVEMDHRGEIPCRTKHYRPSSATES
jgi:hypothetical protein